MQSTETAEENRISTVIAGPLKGFNRQTTTGGSAWYAGIDLGPANSTLGERAPAEAEALKAGARSVLELGGEARMPGMAYIVASFGRKVLEVPFGGYVERNGDNFVGSAGGEVFTAGEKVQVKLGVTVEPSGIIHNRRVGPLTKSATPK
jgi:hypothetical protein